MKEGKAVDDRCLREQEFHDALSECNARDMADVVRFFEGATSPENRFILQRLGSLENKRILDLGCGSAGSSVYFARLKALPVATDISDEMLNFTRELARCEGVELECRVVNAMDIDYPDETFDVVYAANVLHHTAPEETLREARRVLKPEGMLAFIDPLRHNPVINLYRRMATDVRTPDEAPLDISIVRTCRELFSEVQYDTFWLSSLWIFVSFYLFEGVHPNDERYWVKVLREEKRLAKRFNRLNAIDGKLKEILPFLRRYAWNIALVAKK